MRQVFKNYIQNLKIYNQINCESAEKNVSKEQLVAFLKCKAERKRIIQTQNNEFLDGYIYSLDKMEFIPQTCIDELEEFAKALIDGFDNLDNGVSYVIYRVLLREYKKTTNYNKIVQYLYNYAYCEYVILYHTLFPVKKLSFCEILDYLDYYDGLSLEGKKYFLRCVANTTLMDIYNVDRILQIIDFFEEKKKQEPMLSHDIERYILSLNRNISGSVSFIRDCDYKGKQVTKEYREKVYLATKKSLDYMGGAQYTSQPNIMLYYYTYYCASYHTKRISLDALLNRISELGNIKTYYSMEDCGGAVLSMGAALLEYIYIYKPQFVKENEEIAEMKMHEVIAFLDQLSVSDYTSVIDRGIIRFTNVISKILPYEKCKDFLFNVMLARDKSLLTHTVMVEKLCIVIIEEMLETNPEYFVGILDNYTIDDILSNKDRIVEMMSGMALFHDLGKTYCLDYIQIAHRRLISEEFSIIQLHPLLGQEMLEKTFFPKEIMDGILLHHVWYNHKLGYPKIEYQTNNQPLIDILSIADSIDAATDYVGRIYTLDKPLDLLLLEFEGFKGTRYSPYVLDVVKSAKVKSVIERVITKNREDFVYEIWTE